MQTNNGHEPLSWYVMLHGSPQLIDFQLRRENAARQEDEDSRQQAIDYFIPFTFLTHILEDKASADLEDIRFTNSLRDDFHDFVFIHTDACGIQQLRESRWNRSQRYRLRHYRDVAGHEVILSDCDMHLLISLFSEKRIKFSIGLPTPEILPGETVTVVEPGLFTNREARVVAVKHTAVGISLTLGIEMFGGEKEVRLYDKRPEDIRSSRTMDDIVGIPFLHETEQELLDILSRRVNHKETEASRREDAAVLNRRFIYSYLTVADPLLSARFLAQMLICATLRFDRDSQAVLAQQARSLLADGATLPPDILAALCASLYMTTRDADHRTAAQHHLRQIAGDVPEPLRRLVSLVGRLRAKRKRHSSI